MTPADDNFRSAALAVSVIIVSWNARKHLLNCLASLTPQTCKFPMEIIVVDNASTDGSPESVSAQHPDVRLIQNGENLGFARSNNIGIAASSGRYLALINSDVKVLPDCLSRLVEFCEAHPRTGICGPRVVGRDGRLQRSCYGFPTLWNVFCRATALDALFPASRLFTGLTLTHWSQDTVRSVGILSGCFWLVRREALTDVGTLDERFFMYAEDYDWCRRFWKHGWEVTFVPTAEAIHYGGGSSSNAPVRFFIARHHADLQYWRKHHSSTSLACYLAILWLQNLLRVAGYSIWFLLRSQCRQDSLQKVRRSNQCLKWLTTDGLKALFERSSRAP